MTTLAGLADNPGSADGMGSSARFGNPTGVAIDPAGYVYVTDYHNNTIRQITPEGVVTTLAGLAGSSGNTDGAGIAARFNGPSSIAIDATGNLYVADYYNATIRQITRMGEVSTLAGRVGAFGSADGPINWARFYGPWGVATDTSGNVYVAEVVNHRIRRITITGSVTTLAGRGGFGSADGAGSAARFWEPRGVATDAANNVYVADYENHTIRKISPAGEVSTLAGLAGNPGSADGTLCLSVERCH